MLKSLVIPPAPVKRSGRDTNRDTAEQHSDLGKGVTKRRTTCTNWCSVLTSSLLLLIWATNTFLWYRDASDLLRSPQTSSPQKGTHRFIIL